MAKNSAFEDYLIFHFFQTALVISGINHIIFFVYFLISVGMNIRENHNLESACS